MSPGYAKFLHALYPAANLRQAYIDGHDHPDDFPEGWGYSTFSAEGDAFRHGQMDATKTLSELRLERDELLEALKRTSHLLMAAALLIDHSESRAHAIKTALAAKDVISKALGGSHV